MPNQPGGPAGGSRSSAAASASVRDWSRYFDAVGDGGPRQTLLDAADLFDGEGIADRADQPLAVDLGCGTGRDTIELLRRGWRVLAVDGEGEAIDRLLDRPKLRALVDGDRLRVGTVDFDRVELPRCTLVNASFALPFCPPRHFDGLWRRIVTAIEPGGRFAGQLFGEQDDWARLPDRSHHTPEQVQRLLSGFEIESLRTQLDEPDPDAVLPKRWHVFHVIARRLA